MSNKSFSNLYLIIIVLSIFIINIPGVKGTSNNLILCDSCTNCSSAIENANSGDEILLTTNIFNAEIGSGESCIEFQDKNNMIFNCNNFAINGSDQGYGIYLYNNNFNTIQNCYISNFYNGLFLDFEVTNNTFFNITTQNCVYGNVLVNSNENFFENLDFLDNQYGIYFQSSNENSFLNTNVFNNNYGMVFQCHSDNNSFFEFNVLEQSEFDIYLSSNSYYNSFVNGIIDSNFNIYSGSSMNFWNSSSQGNLWLNFDSELDGCIPNQQGICGESIIINSNNIDYLPITGNPYWTIIPTNITKSYFSNWNSSINAEIHEIMANDEITLTYSVNSSLFKLTEVNNSELIILENNSTLDIGQYYLKINATYGNKTISKNILVEISISLNFTTNFDEEDTIGSLENITNLVLEVNNTIILNFSNSSINITNINLDQAIMITENSINIDTETYPSLNHSAEIEFLNISFNNPGIFLNNILCSETICSVTQTYNQTLKKIAFTVTHFSNYSVTDYCGNQFCDINESNESCPIDCDENYLFNTTENNDSDIEINLDIPLNTNSESGSSGGGGSGGAYISGINNYDSTNNCNSSWNCSSWNPTNCIASETQTRTCEDINNCETELNKPLTSRMCDQSLVNNQVSNQENSEELNYSTNIKSQNINENVSDNLSKDKLTLNYLYLIFIISSVVIITLIIIGLIRKKLKKKKDYKRKLNTNIP